LHALFLTVDEEVNDMRGEYLLPGNHSV